MDYYSLAVNNLNQDSSNSKITISVTMNSEDARALGKSNVGILYVCKLHKAENSEPIAFKDYSGHKPTIDEPRESTSIDHLIDVDLYQIWLYDKRSGKVLTKHFVQS